MITVNRIPESIGIMTFKHESSTVCAGLQWEWNMKNRPTGGMNVTTKRDGSDSKQSNFPWDISDRKSRQNKTLVSRHQ